MATSNETRTADAIDRYEADVAHFERINELGPRVLADRRDGIRLALSIPNSYIDELTQDAFSDALMHIMLDTLKREAAKSSSKPRAVADEDLGRAFRSWCERAIDYAARQGLDDAIEERLRIEALQGAAL